MKIVVLDGYCKNPGDLGWEKFEALGEITLYDRTPDELAAERIGDAQAAIVNKVAMTAEVMAACPQLKYIGVSATGYNNVDLAAAKERGIVVTNIPTYGTDSVGQTAIALLLEICHHVGHHSAEVYKGRWENNPDWCFWDYPLIELAGKTMGIVGFGRIGRTTGRIAKALGMEVIAFDAYRDPAMEAAGYSYVDMDELYARSDVIALHCPLMPQTRGMINRESIAKMKDGVILLNNSRGPLVKEQDLCDALESGKVYAAGVDVVSSEPIHGDNPLLKAKNCFITPHISGATVECRRRLMDIAADNLAAFLAGKPVNTVGVK